MDTPARLTAPPCWAQNSYGAKYLSDKLDIGTGSAAYGVKRNPLLRAKSSIASIAHKMDDMVRCAAGSPRPHSLRRAQSASRL